jgi:hypothetical protein
MLHMLTETLSKSPNLQVVRRNVLIHHTASTPLVIVAHLEDERRLGHAVGVFITLLEDELVAFSGLCVTEETVVHDKAGINTFSHSAIRESIPVDLSNNAYINVSKSNYQEARVEKCALAHAKDGPSRMAS